jgi:hypothetical protein
MRGDYPDLLSDEIEDESALDLGDFEELVDELAELAEETVFDDEASATSAKSFADAIRIFGGKAVNPSDYSLNLEGFQKYLDDTGVIYFTAKEMITPRNRTLARKFGYENFLPKHEWWPRGAALAKLADHCRFVAASPVTMRNWWRPKGYNEAVGGAAGGDHPTAHAVDLDYQSMQARCAAESMLKTYRATWPWLKMSLGLGYRTTHVGLMSPRGERWWPYKSYKPCR